MKYFVIHLFCSMQFPTKPVHHTSFQKKTKKNTNHNLRYVTCLLYIEHLSQFHTAKICVSGVKSNSNSQTPYLKANSIFKKYPLLTIEKIVDPVHEMLLNAHLSSDGKRKGL